MMKYASMFLFSAFLVLFIHEIKNLNLGIQESLINCLKLRKEVPELKLKCEDMLFNISKNKHDFDKISLIELNSIKKEPRFFDSQKTSRDEETAAAQAAQAEQAELKRIEKLEKMMESLNGNVQIMNEELKILKSSIYKKHSGDQNLINRKINEKRNTFNVANRKSEFKIPQKENRLKMKTFNDLELDLNSEKSREKNIDIKQEDFLKNILNITQDDLIKGKTKEEIGSRATKMKSNMQNIQTEKPNANAYANANDKKSKKMEDDAEKLLELIKKLKQDRKDIFNGIGK